MITNIYIKQLFRILKKYGQVNFFKTHVKMEELQSIIVKTSPYDYFCQINLNFLKNRIPFACEISEEYNNFINSVYKKKIVEYLQKENLYDTIKYEYECDENSWKKIGSFEEYLDNSQWYNILPCAFDWNDTAKYYEYWENLNDRIEYMIDSQRENF